MDKSRALLVEGARPIRDSLGKQLTAAGFDVVAVGSGAAAVDLIGGAEFAVVVGEFKLPDMSGLELVREVRARDRLLPVILLSEKADARFESAARIEGALEFLVKPVASEAVVTAARDAERVARLVRTWNPAPAIDLSIAVSASEAKNQFGQILDRALAKGGVLINKHDVPKAVLLSYESFERLAGRRSDPLETLREEFDALLAKMQTPSAKAGMRRAFEASPEELAKAAVEGARRRKKARGR